MPLSMGHTALGLASYEFSSKNNDALSRLKIFIFISILANLPDLDVIVGLLFKGNGNVFHRGPSHSLAFALIMGFLISRAWRFSSLIPRLKFRVCFLIVFSHVLADFFFTASPISFFWPFEVSWSSGFSSWGDVLSSVLFKGFQDLSIIMGCVISIILTRMIRAYSSNRYARLPISKD